MCIRDRVNSPELREAYNENLTKLTDFGSDLSQDERLYAKYKQIQVSPDFAKLTPAQQKIINNEVRDFKLGGAEPVSYTHLDVYKRQVLI